MVGCVVRGKTRLELDNEDDVLRTRGAPRLR